MITKGNNYSNANDENLQEIRANKIWLFFSLQKLVCATVADTFFAFMGTSLAFTDTYLWQKYNHESKLNSVARP